MSAFDAPGPHGVRESLAMDIEEFRRLGHRMCAEERLWFHVDGAYGAPGVLDPSVAASYAGMARADSLAINPHKWLSIPVECGCAFVGDGRLLRETFSLVPPYLQTEEGKGFGGLPWYSEYGFQQTRGFRALKLWMTIQQLGHRGLAAHVARHNALARRLAAMIDEADDLRGRFSLRACILHYATTEADLESLLDIIRGTGVRLAAAMTVG